MNNELRITNKIKKASKKGHHSLFFIHYSKSIMVSVLAIILYSLFFIQFTPSAEAGTIIKSPAYLGLSRGLVGCWTFDGSYTNFPDCSGSNNPGFLFEPPKRTVGKIGQALNFDGSNDYVYVGDFSSLNMGTSDWTVAFWVKMTADAAAAAPTLMAKTGFLCGADSGWVVGIFTSGRVSGVFGNAGTCDVLPPNDGAIVADGSWHHVVVVWNRASNMIRYVDGVVTGTPYSISNLNGSNIATDKEFCIGARCPSGPQDYMAGSIDDVRVYNRALSATEIQRLYLIGLGSKANRTQTSMLTQGLVGHWTFDGVDIFGTSARDRSGQGNHGTIGSGVLKTIGKIGQALDFDSSDDVDLGDPASINPANLSFITMSGWIKADTNVNGHYILAKDDGVGANPTRLNFQNTGESRCSVGGTNATSSGLGLKVGIWYHFVCTYDGSNVRNYINAVEVAITPKTGAIADLVGENWRIGRRAANASDGQIDDVRIYNRALSVAEINRLYQQTQSKYNASKTDSLTQGLTGHWTFDAKNIFGTSVRDTSGNSRHGSNSGAAKAIGKIGQALSFDGIDDNVHTSTALSSFISSSTGTISAWIKPMGTGLVTTNAFDSPAIVMDRDGVGGGYIGITQASIGGLDLIWFYNWDGSEKRTGFAYKVGEWIHVVWRHNGDVLYAFKNGVLEASTAAGNTESVAISLAFGTNYQLGGSTKYFNGLIDDVRIYDRALSNAEIMKLYQMGR